MGHDVFEEEVEEPPGIPDEEVKVDTTKQQKEEPIDKDLIYRENEEEVFDSDLDTEQTIVSELPKSEGDVLPPAEIDPLEQLQKLLDEEMKHDISFADMARGYMKEAYEGELKKIEEQKRLEEERIKLEEERKKLEMEKSKQKDKKKKGIKQVKTAEELSEEGLEEEEEEVEEEEEEFLRKEASETERRQLRRMSKRESDESEPDKEMPILTKPKYAPLRRLTHSLKCKDLVQRIPSVEPTKKRKVKKVLIKKVKGKLKVQTPVEQIPDDELQEVSKVSLEESSTAEGAAQFKWGLPLLEYFQQIGRRTSSYTQGMTDDSLGDQDQDDDKEVGTEGVTTVPKDEAAPEESEQFSSGLTIGKTESFHSSQVSKDESISIDEEEEENNKTDELGEEENDETV